MDSIKTHRDLDVWRKAIEFSLSIYELTSDFPSEEKFGLVSQMRRAVVSIPSNIAEGASRKSNAEFIQFLYVSRGSACELETQLMISNKLHYMEEYKHRAILEDIVNIQKMLSGLIKSLKNRGSEL